MKRWAFLISLAFYLPSTLMSQTVDATLQKVSAALSDNKDSQAVALFKQAIGFDIDKSEMYYWTEVDKNSRVSIPLAQELATYYKNDRNYDKAYLFYKEVLQKDPDNVKYLVPYAEMEVFRGKEADALRTYEKVLRQDPENLSANIFIGNYYYLQAEQEKDKLEQDYKKIHSPSKVQLARYRDELKGILATGYGKAKECLEKVVRQFPSTEAVKTLNKIKLIEKEVNK